MRRLAKFSNGMELATCVTSSGVLDKSWNVIMSYVVGIVPNEGEGLSWKVYREPDSGLMIIAFEVKKNISDIKEDLVESSALITEKNFHHFEFLCTEKAPLFKVDNHAISIFYENYEKLDQLKSEINSSTRWIVTGLGLGGSIASLFTISLLDSIGSGKNHPLCITYGSPLIGDKNLQQAISRRSNWNSCFLHVVSLKDSLPRRFISNHSSSSASSTPQTSSSMPFGTFFLCSDSYSTCFENPDTVLGLFVAMGSINGQNQDQKFQSAHYDSIVKNLNHKLISKDSSTLVKNVTHLDSVLATGISLQLRALGLTSDLQQQQNIDMNTLETKIIVQEEKFISQRKVLIDPCKKLNLMKINMAKLEWYKKEMKKGGIGYYDSYRQEGNTWDIDVSGTHNELTDYWKKMVKEVEMKPQREGAAFRTSWLFGGTNYRRMVEPLAIARYYREGGKGYLTETDKRSGHYAVLEKWLEEDKQNTPDSNGPSGNKQNTTDPKVPSRKNVELLLTIDSCFWAHVEEALLSYKILQNVHSSVTEREVATSKLLEFENYVYELLKRYEVSPEIFLKQSSYMKWWNQYRGISRNRELANFMNDPDRDHKYTVGAYEFP